MVHAAREAYMHKKLVAATGSAVDWLVRYALPGEDSVAKAQEQMRGGGGVVLAANSVTDAPGLVVKLNEELAKHRAWDRDTSSIAA